MPKLPPPALRRWIPWPVPERLLALFGGGGLLVTFGTPDEKLRIGRQISATPTFTKSEADAIAKLMNKRYDTELIDAVCPNDGEKGKAHAHASGPRAEVLQFYCTECDTYLVERTQPVPQEAVSNG